MLLYLLALITTVVPVGSQEVSAGDYCTKSPWSAGTCACHWQNEAAKGRASFPFDIVGPGLEYQDAEALAKRHRDNWATWKGFGPQDRLVAFYHITHHAGTASCAKARLLHEKKRFALPTPSFACFLKGTLERARGNFSWISFAKPLDDLVIQEFERPWALPIMNARHPFNRLMSGDGAWAKFRDPNKKDFDSITPPFENPSYLVPTPSLRLSM